MSILTPADVRDLDADIVAIGSAVGLGKWLKRAVRVVEHRSEDLANRSVWLFSSGPVDNDPTSQHGLDDDPLAHLVATTGAHAHHVFPGRLDRAERGPVESLLTRLVHAPDGDVRDWQDVDVWAEEILAASRSPRSERVS